VQAATLVQNTTSQIVATLCVEIPGKIRRHELQSSTESYWAENASQYDKNKNGSIEQILKAIASSLDSSASLLDIATGTGVAAIKLCKFAHHVDAIDSEEKMLAVAREKIKNDKIENIHLHKQNAYALEFKDSIFDTVVMLNSLHVMEKAELALKEIRRVIKPTGVLFSPTYCHAQTNETLNNYKNWSQKSGHKSYHLFTCDSLCELIEKSGFNIKQRESIFIRLGQDNMLMAIGYVVSVPTV